MRIPIEQAAADALAAWLRSQLARCIVKPEWAGSSATLQNRTVTIVPIGDRIDSFHDATMLSATPPSNGQTTSEWRLANAEQRVQIDVWCTTPADRHDVCAMLDDALNAGSLPMGAAAQPADPAAPGLLVPLAGAYAGGTASFLFDSTRRIDSADANGKAEFRAMKRGKGWFALTRKHADPALQNIKGALRTGTFPGGLPAPAPTVGATPPTGNAYGTVSQSDTPPGANPKLSGL